MRKENLEKKAVSGVILTLLLVGMLTLAFNIQQAWSFEPPTTEWIRTYGAGAPAISVVPSAVVDETLGPGESFSVDIVISDVTNLGGYEFQLSFDSSLLHVTDVTVVTDWFAPVKIWKKIFNSGLVWPVVTLPEGTVVGVDGTGTVATIDFTVDDYGTTVLDLHDTLLGDPFADPISHQTNDGFFTNNPLTHDVAVISVTALPTAVPQGDPVYINVTVENQGDFLETFDVTVYADQEKHLVGDEIIVGMQTVYDLPAGFSQIVYYVWDTTGVPYGNYWISAEASVVPGETDTAVNILTGAYLGGICRPFQEPRMDVFACLVQISSVIATVTALGVAGMGLLKVLGSQQLRLPMRRLKSKP